MTPALQVLAIVGRKTACARLLALAGIEHEELHVLVALGYALAVLDTASGALGYRITPAGLRFVAGPREVQS